MPENILGYLLSRGEATAIKSGQPRTNNPLLGWFMGWARPDPDQFDITDEGLVKAYLASLWAYRCTKLRGMRLSSIPLLVKTLDDHYVDSEGRAVDEPVVNRVRQHILQRMIGPGSTRVWRNTEYDMCIWGRGFIDPTRQGLMRLNPSTMEVIKDSQNGIEKYRQTLNGSVTAEWKPDELVYLYDFDPTDDLSGLSPLAFALKAVGAEVSVDEFFAAFFKNDATPAGILTTDQPLSETEIETTNKWWKKLFGGNENRHKVGIVGSGLKFEQIASDIGNLALPELRLEVRREVCAAFGVPMTIAGADESANFSTSKEQHLAFYEETLIPEMEMFVDELNRQLVPRFNNPNLKIVAELSGIKVLQEAKTELSARYVSLWQGGIYTLNEARQAEGLPANDEDYVNAPNVGIVKVADLPGVAARMAGLSAPPGANADLGIGVVEGADGETIPAPPPPGDKEQEDNKPEPPGAPAGDFAPQAEQPDEATESVYLPAPKGRRQIPLTLHHGEIVSSKAMGVAAEDVGKAAYVALRIADPTAVQAAQDKLHAAIGNDGAEYEPPSHWHVTLLYCPDVSDAVLSQIAREIALPDPVSLQAAGTLVFESEEDRALCVALRKTTDLMSLQRHVYDLFAQRGLAVSPYSTPGRFRPHITVAYLADAVEAPDAPLDFTAEGDRVEVSRDNYTVIRTITATQPMPPPAKAILTQAALDDLKRWQKKVLAKGVKASFQSAALPSAIRDFLRWDLLDAGEDKAAIKSAFDKAAETLRSKDPTPEEFQEFWDGIDDQAQSLVENLGDMLSDSTIRERLAKQVEDTGDPEMALSFFDTLTDEYVNKLVGSEDEPGPLAAIFMAGAARGQQLHEKLQAVNLPTPKRHTRKAAVQLATAWDMLHKDALAYARNYAYELVKGINTSTTGAFREAMGSWIEKGGSLPGLVDLLLGRLRGLDIPAGWSDAKIKWATSKDRARTIAQTESTRIFTDGNVARWKQLGVQEIKWRTQNDGNRVCPFCQAMNGRIGTVADGWDVPLEHAAKYGGKIKRMPGHPGCRCFPSPVTVSRTAPLVRVEVKPSPRRKPKPGEIAIAERRG